MSERVLAVLDALRIRYRVGGKRRVWLLCPRHQKQDDPISWATTCFVRLVGTRKNEEGKSYDAAGQWWCYACSEGGALWRLAQVARGCSEEAARELVARLGGGAVVDAPRVAARVVPRLARAARIEFTLPREVVVEPLAAWPGPAREYAEARGITPSEVDAFGIGHAVSGRLAGRIVFPWRGARGEARGYSARSYAGDEPKYLTPAESEGADLDAMFGESLWPARESRDEIVVAEGAINAMAARRALAAAVAALGGSEPRPGQVAKLATFRRVVVMTDADEAGEKAWRALRALLVRHVELVRARPPEGRDAAEMTPGELRALLGCAIMG